MQKKNIVFIAGALAWLFVGASWALTNYEKHQQVLAAQNTQQTQLVNQTEAKLSGELSAAKTALQQAQLQADTFSQQKQTACSTIAQAIAELSKYHVNLVAPSACN